MEHDDKDSTNRNADITEDYNFGSEFSHLYKNSGKGASVSQQERRDLLLRGQKEKRHTLVDSYRDFSELFLEDNNEEIMEFTEDINVDLHSKYKKENKFRLMRSEWFCEVPVDLEENWFAKLAPQGFRVLVIAKKRYTVVLNDRGKVLTLKTHLPGGGFDKSCGLTVLDCIYNKVTKTIFVLDCLFWNTMSMLDSETSFRFYWIKNKFDENYKLSETNKGHKIYVVDFFPAQKPLIQDKIFEVLTVSNQQILHEGVVFYHKELHYTLGKTPLLGWLFTYMLPEKLGISVPEENMKKIPKNYECLEKYLEEHSKRVEKKNYQKRRLEKQMDTS